jgi:hypothetical protein
MEAPTPSVERKVPKYRTKKRWLVAVGFSKYRVSDYGDIVNERNIIITPDTRDKYPSVKMTGDDGIRRQIGVHIVVANTFVHNPYPNINNEVDHINRIEYDPHFSNLRHVDRFENSRNKRTAKENTARSRTMLLFKNGELYYEGTLSRMCEEFGFNKSSVNSAYDRGSTHKKEFKIESVKLDINDRNNMVFLRKYCERNGLSVDDCECRFEVVQGFSHYLANIW